MAQQYEKLDYNSMREADEVSIWKRISKGGKQYFSGVIKVGDENIKFVAFPSEFYEEGGKKPILTYKKMDDSQPRQSQAPRQNEENTATEDGGDDIRIEDVPF